MHAYVHMVRKTISLTKETYERLKARKGPREGFSSVIFRLTGRRPLADFAGILGSSSARALRKAIQEARRDRRSADCRDAVIVCGP